MKHQLALNVALKEEALFETFVPSNEQIQIVLDDLKHGLMDEESQFICFTGEEPVGKTHLLQAACRFKTDYLMQSRSQVSNSSLYLSFKDSDLSQLPDILNGLEQISVVAIDDIDIVFESDHSIAWEQALANLILKSKTYGHTVLMSSKHPFTQWRIFSKELLEALVSVISVEVMPLNIQQDLVLALQKRSKKLGFDLSLEVGNFLIKQFSKDFQELLAVLKILEEASFVEKRRLTLPFVKKVLAG